MLHHRFNAQLRDKLPKYDGPLDNPLILVGTAIMSSALLAEHQAQLKAAAQKPAAATAHPPRPKR